MHMHIIYKTSFGMVYHNICIMHLKSHRIINMKQIALVLVAILGWCACARLDNFQYLPPSQRPSVRPGASAFGTGAVSGLGVKPNAGGFGFGSPSSGGRGFVGGSAGASDGYSGATTEYNAGGGGSYAGGGGRAGAGSEIPIIRYESVNEGDGIYHFSYESGNGISAEEQGYARGDGTKSQGLFAYTAPDGQQIQLQYSADENGYNPQGAHIPTPPPIPPEIQRSIEQNLADEARGIVNDGAYKPEAEEDSVVGYYSQGRGGAFQASTASGGGSGGGGNVYSSGNGRISSGGFEAKAPGGFGGSYKSGSIARLGSGQSSGGSGYRY